MIYFTRGWANGELSDDETDRVEAAYQSRLKVIEPSLSEPMRQLAYEINLHDAVIEAIEWSPGSKALTLELIADARDGFSWVSLTYFGAMLGARRIESLQNVGRDREACVLYDEVDLDSDGSLVHRLLFWPNEELTVDFERLELRVEARADRRIRPGDAFLEIES